MSIEVEVKVRSTSRKGVMKCFVRHTCILISFRFITVILEQEVEFDITFLVSLHFLLLW